MSGNSKSGLISCLIMIEKKFKLKTVERIKKLNILYVVESCIIVSVSYTSAVNFVKCMLENSYIFFFLGGLKCVMFMYNNLET